MGIRACCREQFGRRLRLDVARIDSARRGSDAYTRRTSSSYREWCLHKYARRVAKVCGDRPNLRHSAAICLRCLSKVRRYRRQIKALNINWADPRVEQTRRQSQREPLCYICTHWEGLSARALAVCVLVHLEARYSAKPSADERERTRLGHFGARMTRPKWDEPHRPNEPSRTLKQHLSTVFIRSGGVPCFQRWLLACDRRWRSRCHQSCQFAISHAPEIDANIHIHASCALAWWISSHRRICNSRL